MSRERHERDGRRAERLAELLLRLKGFQIAARRYRAPVGEIDLVCRRGGLVVFVEVKRRSHLATAGEAVTPRQRERIARAAEHWLAHHGGCEVRFDAVLLAPRTWPRHVVDAWRPT